MKGWYGSVLTLVVQHTKHIDYQFVICPNSWSEWHLEKNQTTTALEQSQWTQNKQKNPAKKFKAAETNPF